jgi:DNA sulfur modification protein DndD
MKLDNIEIENFRQYGSIQRATFSTHPEKNITVFNGNNGCGKTSLFVAINWCLYGEGAENIGELINKEAVKKTTAGQEVTARVKLSFRHGGERFISSRELCGIKREDGSVETRLKPSFSLMRIQADGQAIEIKNPIGMMNTILPSNVRTFFLFDGEKIDNFAKPDCGEEVRYAIYNVLKLEILERAKNHLSHVAAEHRKELKQASSGELLELLESEDRKRKEKETAANKIPQLERERDSAKRKIIDIDKRLRELQSARILQLERDGIQEQLERNESDLRNLVKEIREITIRHHSIIASGAIEKARAILDKKRERGEIPSGIRQQFVRDLLEQGECICGRPIKDGDASHDHLQAILKRSVSGTLEDKVLNTNVTLNVLAAQNVEVHDQLESHMKRRVQFTDRIRDLQSQLDDVTRQLQGSPIEEISELEGKRKTFEMDIEHHHLEIGKCRGIIEDREREITELTKRIEQAQKRKSQNELLTRKISLAQQSADAIEKIYQELAENVRGNLEAKTQEIFKKLVWKESQFKNISLGSDYQLEVIDRYGLPARPELSAGEREVLSLSFITAMVRVSEEEAPIVMDTPFGKLSSEHRASITENLPRLTPQLVLFVTDEELRDEARKNLEGRIGKEYRLIFDPKISCTTIEEVA